MLDPASAEAGSSRADCTRLIRAKRQQTSADRRPDAVVRTGRCGGQPRPFCVGFAAETRDVEAYARDKLERKKLDMIAANLVGDEHSGFEID